MSIIADIEKIIEPIVSREGLELVDVQFGSEHGKKVLRVFIDREGGVKLADCEHMTRSIGEELDPMPQLHGSYILEVSSPGFDRALKKEKDFIRFTGSRVRIVMAFPIDGQRNFCGPIISVENGAVTIDDVTGKTAVLPLDRIIRARLEPEA